MYLQAVTIQKLSGCAGRRTLASGLKILFGALRKILRTSVMPLAGQHHPESLHETDTEEKRRICKLDIKSKIRLLVLYYINTNRTVHKLRPTFKWDVH